MMVPTLMRMSAPMLGELTVCRIAAAVVPMVEGFKRPDIVTDDSDVAVTLHHHLYLWEDARNAARRLARTDVQVAAYMMTDCIVWILAEDKLAKLTTTMASREDDDDPGLVGAVADRTIEQRNKICLALIAGFDAHDLKTRGPRGGP